MKQQLLLIAVLFVALGSAFAQHEHAQEEGSKTDHTMQDGTEMENGQVMTYDVSTDFKQQLTAVYNESLKLTGSFIASEVDNASNNSAQVKDVLGKVDMSLLESSEAHMDWMMNLKEMNIALEKIHVSKDLGIQRDAYASFNQALYRSLKSFGTVTGSIYYQYCPMALDNQGGFWLSNSEEIKNPYFGSSMMTCGSTKETIN